MEPTKKCTKCNTEKSLDNYYINRKYKYGVHSICKVCLNACTSIKRKCECGKYITRRAIKYHESTPFHILYSNKTLYEN